jgi:hypothetical protein
MNANDVKRFKDDLFYEACMEICPELADKWQRTFFSRSQQEAIFAEANRCRRQKIVLHNRAMDEITVKVENINIGNTSGK